MKGTNQTETCQGFCSECIHRQVSSLAPLSKTLIASLNSYVEVWPQEQLHLKTPKHPATMLQKASSQLSPVHWVVYPKNTINIRPVFPSLID